MLEILEVVKNSQIAYLELSDEGGRNRRNSECVMMTMDLAAFPPRIAGGPPATWVGV